MLLRDFPVPTKPEKFQPLGAAVSVQPSGVPSVPWFCTSCGAPTKASARFCIKCGCALNFPVGSKRHEDTPPAQQPKHHEEKAAPQQPYPWGAALTWVLFAFQLGLIMTHPPRVGTSAFDPINSGAFRVMGGIIFAVFTALIIGALKIFKRTPDRFFRGAFGLPADASSADKIVFSFSVVLVILFAGLALFFQRYGLLADAAICGLLGAGVKFGFAPSRWLLAVYAFMSPIFVLFLKDSPGGAGVIWPFFFFAVCGSILAHQRESPRNVASAGNTFHAIESSSIDTTSQKADQKVGVPKPAITREPAWDRQFNNASTESRTQATPTEVGQSMLLSPPAPNPIPPVLILDESSQKTTEAHEELLYAQIAQELDTNTVDKGLWTKMYVQAGGDDQQTRVLYIKARLARLVAMEAAQREAMRREQQKGRV